MHPSKENIAMQPLWRNLLFLHWPIPPETIQSHLPEGLKVHTFEDQAYIGLVPFTMADVRPSFMPNLGRIAHFYEEFAELNVRTYVTRNGVPGVWFFSLDAASTPAVITARIWFGLPYFRARMRFWQGRDGALRYQSRRLWPNPKPARCSVRYRPEGIPAPATPGSLEEFLVERYVLFSRKNGQWYSGRVHHEPYRIQTVQLEHLREDCVLAAGFKRPYIAPHAVYSPGVDVKVSPLELC